MFHIINQSAHGTYPTPWNYNFMYLPLSNAYRMITADDMKYILTLRIVHLLWRVLPQSILLKVCSIYIGTARNPCKCLIAKYSFLEIRNMCFATGINPQYFWPQSWSEWQIFYHLTKRGGSSLCGPYKGWWPPTVSNVIWGQVRVIDWCRLAPNHYPNLSIIIWCNIDPPLVWAKGT